MCEECQRLLEDYRSANEEFRAIIRTVADAALSREVDVFNKLWRRGLEFSQKSENACLLLVAHLKSHGS
jgi:hypothetical protein